MKKSNHPVKWGIVAAFVTVLTSQVNYAADTTETFDRGASDAELYFGYDGVGLKNTERMINSEFVVGFGLLERLSVYITAGLEATDQFSNAAGALNFGLFGTPIDKDHFDLDLFFNLGVGGEGFSEFQATPSLELNLDHDPEHRTFGFYLRGGVPIYGRELAVTDPEQEPSSQVTAHLESTAGAYYTLTDGHQLLLEYDMGFRPDPAEDEHAAEIGGLTLGYNIGLGDYIELINQVFLDIPQDNETTAWGFSVGFIATMPSPNVTRLADAKDETPVVARSPATTPRRHPLKSLFL